MLLKLICICLVGATVAQDYQEYQPQRPAPTRIQTSNSQTAVRPTPIPILKQINRHNEDGSYTYGYEGADGSFKIETKLATGEVKGKYGYVDETGKHRVVEYGANKYGFQPSGEGITVAPPTLVDETTDKNGNHIPDYEDEPQPQSPQQKQFIPRVSKPQAAQQRPQPHYVQYQQPEEQHHQQQQYAAPAPARSQIANASPIDVVYSARPRPARPGAEYSQTETFLPTPQVRENHQQDYAPSPIGRAYTAPRLVQQQQQQSITYSTPRVAQQPQPQQQQQHVSYAAPPAQNGRSSSVLDQLAKDFALPQGGSPALHDISYSYY